MNNSLVNGSIYSLCSGDPLVSINKVTCLLHTMYTTGLHTNLHCIYYANLYEHQVITYHPVYTQVNITCMPTIDPCITCMQCHVSSITCMHCNVPCITCMQPYVLCITCMQQYGPLYNLYTSGQSITALLYYK